MRYVHFENGCTPEQMTIRQADRPMISDNQVGLKVSAFGVNRADTLQRQGKYPPPKGESSILGLEVSGAVVEVGSKVTDWEVGDKVFGLVAGGGYAEFVAADSRHIMRVPDGVSEHDAAGLAEVFITAYQSLFAIGKLRKGQAVLLHAGASGVSLAALQLAHNRGCRVAVTASTEQKLNVCKSLGADVLINYTHSDFTEVLRDSDFRADFILDYVGGDYLNRNLKCLQTDGTIVCLAMLAGRYADNLDMALLVGKRATIQGSTLRNRSDDYKAALIEGFSREFLPLFQSHKLKPVTDTIMSVSEVGEAHARLEQNKSQGKLICYW